MEETTFFGRYRICEDDAAQEVSRTGAAINHKAIDTETHAPVLLQLIPIAPKPRRSSITSTSRKLWRPAWSTNISQSSANIVPAKRRTRG
jgi:hypothetical protein